MSDLKQRSHEFREFILMYLGEYLKNLEPCACDELNVEGEHLDLPAFHKEWIGLTEFKRLAIAAPRSFAKSSYFSVFYPLFCALEGWAEDILIISSSQQMAEGWLLKIKRELESNPLMERFNGNQVSDVWRQDHIELVNGVVVRAKGSGCMIRGMRPDLVVVDDLENDDDVWSETCRVKLNDWFWKTLVNVLNPDAQLITIGTLLHPEALLSKIVAEPPKGWVSKVYKALQDDGSSIWPGKWSKEELEQRRGEIGTVAFEQEFQNNPIPSEWRTFKESEIKYYEHEPPLCAVFTTVDPASSLETRTDPDYTAIVTIAVDSNKNIYVVDYTRKRLLPAETITEIIRHYETYHPECIGIEQIGFQKVLKFYFDQECQRLGIYPYMKEINTGGMRKRFRIERLQPYFEKGKVFIKSWMSDLKTELLSYPTGKHDDLIDSLASVIELIRAGGKEKSHYPENSFGTWWDGYKKRRKLGGTIGDGVKVNPWSRLFN